MDKPLNMPIKDYLIKVMSVRMNIPSATIEKVINNQFESAAKAVHEKHTSLEISGFGKFLFNKKRAIKRIEKEKKKIDKFKKLLEEEPSELKISSYTRQINYSLETIRIIESKLKYESETDNSDI